MADEVRVKITADSSAAEGAFGRVTKATKDLDSQTASVVGNIKSHWLGATAAIAGAGIAATKAWSMIKEGAGYDETAGLLDNLTQKYSTSADAIVQAMQKASDGLISRANLMQVALGGISKGLRPEQLINLADAARILSDTVGKTATEALQDLTTALETGRTKGLKNYTGATLDLKDAFGELESRLTGSEKAQAMYLLAMIHATKLQNEQNKAVDDAADKIERMEARYADLTRAMSVAFKTAAVELNEFLVRFGQGGDPATIAARYIGSVLFDKKAATGPNVYTVPEIGAENKNPLKDYEDQFAALKKMIEGQKKNEDAIKNAEKAAKELEKQSLATARAVQKATEDAIKDMVEEIERGYREGMERMRGMAEYNEIMYQESRFTTDPYQAAANHIIDVERRKFAIIQELEDKRHISFEEAEKARLLIAENTAKEMTELNRAVFQDQLQSLSTGFGSLSSAFRDIATVYGEGSEAAEDWLEAAKAMEIAQRAVAVVQAVVAIATQGSGDPYTAFARIAAMAAAMGALLGTIGASVSGGSSAAAPPEHARHGTVLGTAAGSASESILNSLAILEDTYNMTDKRLTKIYQELKDLNGNITGIVRNIVMTGGVGNFGSTYWTTPGMEDAQWAKDISGLWGGNIFDKMDNPLGKMLSSFKYFDPLAGSISLFSKLMGSVFGGGTETTQYAGGLQIAGSTLEDIIAKGVSAQQYASYVTKTDGGWFGKDSNSLYNTYKKLDDSVVSTLDLVFKNMSKTLMSLAEGLGADVNAVLAYSFGTVKVNLMGKSGEEISKILTEKFSEIGDKAAGALFGDIIRQYQQLNEGLLETAVRLVVQRDVIMRMLEMTGQRFEGTIPAALRFSQTLIEIAGGLDKLTDAMQAYYDAFFSDSEKQEMLKKQLMEVMGGYGMALPSDRAGYRELVESLDLTTDAGLRAYHALMELAAGADQYYNYIEAARGNVRESDFATRVEYERAVRGFAGGGYHAGGLRVVGEHGPELEFTGPSRIMNTSDSRRALGTDELIAEVRQLRDQVGQASFVSVANSNKIAKLLDQWNGEGLPEERT